MKREELRSFLQAPYDRERWLTLLRSILPTTQPWLGEQTIELRDKAISRAVQIASINLADDRTVAVLEIEVAGHVDLQRNRTGLRNIVSQFIDHQNANAVLAFFVGESSDFRFSFVAKTSVFSPDGQLELNQTAPRRYTYLFGPGQACRTAVERFEQLSSKSSKAKLDDLVSAFKVEPLFKEFYRDYHEVFKTVETHIQSSIEEKEKLRLFVQRLFNRLMFLAFIERKGWLRFHERTDYLSALWEQYLAGKGSTTDTFGFYRNHLAPLFFEGLNQADRPRGEEDPRFGSVPYLNGGLFEHAEDGTDQNPSINIPDEALAAILDSESGLFSRYNFTVAESTPLEIDVAVDPEMLGKVFEELVTGRHEQGSYYTPKPIVAFMGRAALVEYLGDVCHKESKEALESFVHDHKADGISNPEAVFSALRSVKICDPACGSGAYLLGMLHELIELRSCLFASSKKPDGESAHGRKLEIIERNLYGVDKDLFAIGIARLRLWLSLSVEYDGSQPPPALPNLDFKIECGDSLASPAPSDVFSGDNALIAGTVREFQKKKSAFLKSHGAEKIELKACISELKETLKGWLSTDGPEDAFHWAIEFAEVFLPEAAKASLGGELNLGIELAERTETQGFDIVVANPPYVRMELIKPLKPMLRKRFASVHAERADLYIYFYARAQELLRKGGVAAFISSNKWLRAGYGEPLRQHLLDSKTFTLVMDFGDLAVFQSATAYPCIFVWKNTPRGNASTAWAKISNLEACYSEGVRNHFLSLKQDVPAIRFGKNKPRLASSANAGLREQMENSGKRLGEYCNGLIGWGVKTGLNEAKLEDGTKHGVFIINQETRNRLVEEDPLSEEIIKPLLIGEDVRRYNSQPRNSYLIYTPKGINIDRYPAVRRHLEKFRSFRNNKGKLAGLDHRATKQNWYELQQAQVAYSSWFDKPKIIYPEIGLTARFAMDDHGFTINNKAFFLPVADWYLLAVLNSDSAWKWITQTLSPLRGGYWEFRTQYMEKLPIPEANENEQKDIGIMSKKVHQLCKDRRTATVAFLEKLGLHVSQSNFRNPLEQPWSLSKEEYTRRAKKLVGRAPDLDLYENVRDETITLTEEIVKIESDINTRIARLYGLDSEDQKWVSHSASLSRSDDKQDLFFKVIHGLKDKYSYFPTEAIQGAVNDAELAVKDSSLKVYLSEAVEKGILHDAGRGWYSSLSKRAELEGKPTAKLVKDIKKAFPLLDFVSWSTTQLNPWMQHMIAQPVYYVNAPQDALETIGEELRESGWDVAIDPTPTLAPKSVRPGPKMVVLRPALSRQPAGDKYQASTEQILVDLLVETELCSLMDSSEAAALTQNIVEDCLVQIATVQRYANSRKVRIPILESINQRHSKRFSDVN